MKISMVHLIRTELHKTLKMQIVRIIFVFSLAFSLLSFLGDARTSAFSIPLSSISNLTQTLIIVAFISFTAYIYGVELQANTLKIIRSKDISCWKVIGAKYLTAFIVVLIFIMSIWLIDIILAVTVFPMADFTVKYDSNIISARDGMLFVLLAFLFEAMPLFLVSCISLTITIFSNSTVLGVISTIFIFLMSKILESVDALKFFLPSYHLLIWKDIIRAQPDWNQVAAKLVVILLYCVILYLLSLHRYNTMEVKH